MCNAMIDVLTPIKPDIFTIINNLTTASRERGRGSLPAESFIQNTAGHMASI